MPEQKPKRDPGALSTEYHKARKQLMLWAGILMIWELVGVDLEKAKEAQGNVGALIKSIKSPQALPWVLLILVGYFLFKVTIEWYQCNEARRNMRVARIDFTSAWVVALMAYALYFVQTISRVQFADVLQSSNKWQSLFSGFLLGFTLAAGAIGAWRRRKDRRPGSWWTLLMVLSLGFSPIILLSIQGEYINWRLMLIGMVLGIVIPSCEILISLWLKKRRTPASAEG